MRYCAVSLYGFSGVGGDSADGTGRAGASKIRISDEAKCEPDENVWETGPCGIKAENGETRWMEQSQAPLGQQGEAFADIPAMGAMVGLAAIMGHTGSALAARGAIKTAKIMNRNRALLFIAL